MQNLSYLMGRLALAMCCGGALTAQPTQPLSMDATVGTRYGWGGTYTGRDGVAGEITLVPAHRAARIAALTIGGSSSLPYGDICVLAPGTSSGCLPRFPSVVHVGLLGGLERGRSTRALRALVGPALFNGGGKSTLGGQGQIDAAVGGTHVALVVAARGSLVRRAPRETLRLGSLAVGLRVQ